MTDRHSLDQRHRDREFLFAIQECTVEQALELLKLHADSIAAKAFEMAAQEIDDEIYMRENNKDRAGNLLYEDYMRPIDEIAAAIRAKFPASARRQLQLDLLRARLEEAKWWEHLVGWHNKGADCEKDCMYCARIAQLESEIAALEAQK